MRDRSVLNPMLKFHEPKGQLSHLVESVPLKNVRTTPSNATMPVITDLWPLAKY
jgi:hypothetical protein